MDKTTIEFGYFEGKPCNRDGCKGIIQAHEKEGSCSCHISPPCSYCFDDNHYCPECDWSGRDEQIDYESKIPKSSNVFNYKSIQERLNEMEGDKIEYIIKSHTHFSQECVGRYPEGATQEDVRDKVKGTFGGRFTRFSNGWFNYIAYTD